ncbi:MAG: substrate-binding domain-containing protein [Alphaproteobacteria bacterium]|nr:substrate-binding domain-containing protein [Alphaproteobacteria bacterium]
MVRKVAAVSLFLAVVALGASAQAQSEAGPITVASTTSTEQSGLFGAILPRFRARTGIEVKVIAQGTGQALETGRRGDSDVVFVHDPASEERFVAEGFGVRRHEVMYNDFVLIGPKADPAGVRGMTDVAAALARIAARGARFASRGDESGTHKAELRLWQAAGVDVRQTGGAWYRETGSGMGPTLNVASAGDAYTLADRGTWLSFRNRGELEILLAGDRRLLNQYGVILVHPARHPHVRARQGQAFIDWLVSPEGQKAIADFRIGGEQLFFPNAKESAS